MFKTNLFDKRDFNENDFKQKENIQIFCNDTWWWFLLGKAKYFQVGLLFFIEKIGQMPSFYGDGWMIPPAKQFRNLLSSTETFLNAPLRKYSNNQLYESLTFLSSLSEFCKKICRVNDHVIKMLLCCANMVVGQLW